MNERDVFISYHTSTAKQVVEEIGKKLESNGISCWYAPRDCEGNFDEAIIAAINKASIFLLVMNKGSMSSEQVKNEIKAAFDRCSQKHMSPAIFQIDECEGNDTLQYFFGRVHRLSAIPPKEEKLNELLNKIRYIKETAALNGNVYGDFETRILSASINPDPLSVGRKREMQEIFEQVKSYKKIFVCGMGGIGKSKLISQFAATYKNNFRSISWATYETSLKDVIISDKFIRISNFAKSSDAASPDIYYRHKLDYLIENGTEDDLLIIDNFDVEDDDELNEILSLPLSIIFTTRKSRENCYMLYKIDNDDELYELFAKGYPRAVDEKDRQDIKDIIRLLDGHTLAIRLVSRLMKDNRIKPAAMKVLIQEGAYEVLEKSPQERTDHIISNTFKLSNIPQEEQAILYNLAFVPLSGIEACDFYDMCKLNSYNEIDSLIAKNWILHNTATDYISLHPIIHDLCLHKIPFSDTVAENFLQATIDLTVDCKLYDFDKKNWLLNVLDTVLKILPDTSKFYRSFTMASTRLYHFLSKHNEIVKLMKNILAHDVTDTERFRAYYEIASACRFNEDLVQLKEYMALAKDALPKTDFQPVEYAQNLANVYSLHGWYYWHVKDYEQSLKYFSDQLVLIEENSHDIPSDMGWAYFNVAFVLFELNRYAEGMEAANKGIEQFDLVNMDFGKGCCYKSIASYLLAHKDYNMARQYIQNALELFLKSVGEVQADTAASYKILSDINKALGENEQYIINYNKAVDINKQLGLTKVLERWQKTDV